MVQIAVTAAILLAEVPGAMNSAAVVSAQSAFATFYVSPSGNDANPGTEAAPFRTLERARTAVRSVNAGMSGPVIVYLRGGVYTLTSTLTFGAQDSGMNGFQVVYAAYPGETPVISGGQAITGWTADGSGRFRASVGTLRFRQLYVNGKRAVRARTPDAGSYYQLRSFDEGGRRLEVAANQVGNWQRLNQVEMITLGKGVNQSNLRIASITTSGSSAFVTGQDPERSRLFQQGYPIKEPGRPFYFENALEFLTTAGEWYLNTSTNEVTYQPRPGEDMATAVVVAPRLEQVVNITGTLDNPVHDLEFRGLTFEHSTWLTPNSEGYIGDQASVVFTQPLPSDEIASYPGHRLPAGVHVEAANKIRFERNVFRNMGASALNFYLGVNDSTIIGNLITGVSGSGISIDLNLEGNPADTRKICRRNVISNNYISQTGRDYYQTVGIMLGYTDGTIVEHNELSDMPYSGITVGWGWENRANAARNNIVRYNNVSDVLNMMADGGGIYTLSRQPGTLIAENYVHDIVRTSIQGGYNISGIYLDEGSDLITVRDNVLQNTGDRALFQNGNGPSNTFSNNSGSSPTTIANAGLVAAYHDIRPGSSPAPSPPPPPPPTSPLTAAYAFDDGAGTSAADASGMGRTGTLVNGAGWGAGRYGGAVALDGVDDYVMVPSPGLPTGDFTMEAWIFLDQVASFQTIMESLDGLGGPELEFNIVTGGRLEVWSNGAKRLTTSSSMPVGAWTHVALTRSGSTLRAYINASAASQTGTDGTTLSFASCPLLIGVDADSGCTASLNGFLKGRVDNVRIYNRALSASEIQTNMNSGVQPGTSIPPPAAPQNLRIIR
jgi:hypothetical protein